MDFVKLELIPQWPYSASVYMSQLVITLQQQQEQLLHKLVICYSYNNMTLIKNNIDKTIINLSSDIMIINNGWPHQVSLTHVTNHNG